MDSDTRAVRTGGDELVVETAFGEARYSLADDNEDANNQIRGSDKRGEMELEERWVVLTEEVNATLSQWKRGEL